MPRKSSDLKTDFRQGGGGDIHCNRKIFPPPPQLNYHIALPITFLKIDT